MGEQYLGPDTDQEYIKTHLAAIRKLDPIEITTLPKPFNIADTDRLSTFIDVKMFWSCAISVIARLEQQYGVKIDIVQPERYYTALPPESDATGGFHDQRSLGYQYWYQASFVVMLGKMVSKKLRTVELLRDFVHDCLHHSTFRSFRRAARIPAKSPSEAKHRVPEVYREQYGINFRNEDGLSYSSPELTKRSPESINLNLLMDGVVVLVTAWALQAEVGNIECVSTLETELKKEIFIESFEGVSLRHARSFHDSVTVPSKLFIENWGGNYFTTLVLQSMISGDLIRLKQFFEERTGIENAWEKLFKRPEFSFSTEKPIC
ncbi:MAG TPA: hypothetical protein VG866_01280 [Candidatus Paceibacterota bacterium]|nr:hypothetical protein [Candidatus Paceibacterota bacterium]